MQGSDRGDSNIVISLQVVHIESRWKFLVAQPAKILLPITNGISTFLPVGLIRKRSPRFSFCSCLPITGIRTVESIGTPAKKRLPALNADLFHMRFFSKPSWIGFVSTCSTAVSPFFINLFPTELASFQGSLLLWNITKGYPIVKSYVLQSPSTSRVAKYAFIVHRKTPEPPDALKQCGAGVEIIRRFHGEVFLHVEPHVVLFGD